MNFFSKSSVGVEFHDQWIQVVELSQHGKSIELEAFSRVPVPAGLIQNGELKDKIALQPVLKEAFDNANPRAIARKNISVILPTRSVFSHIFKLPLKLSGKDVSQAISYEAENIVPFALEDLYWDYRVLDKEDPKQAHASQYVLFAAVPKTIAESYAELFESTEIHVNLFGVSIDALLQTLEPCLQEQVEKAVVSFGPLSTQIFLLKGNKLRYFFSSNEGYEKFIRNMQIQHKWNEEEFRKKWQDNALEKDQLEELNSFIQSQYAQTQTLLSENQTETLKELIITGEYASLPLFYDLAQKMFAKIKVTIGDPKKNLEVEDTKFLGMHLKKGEKIPLSIYFTNTIGVALTALRKNLFVPINLLPTHLKSTIKQKSLEGMAAICAVVLTVAGLGISGMVFVQHQNYYFERAQLENQKQMIENTLYGTRYQEIKALFSNFNNELAALSKIEAGLFSVSDLIQEIYVLLPNGITISTFMFDDRNLVLELNGVAQTREKLLELQEIMENNEMIKKVSLPLSNFDKKTDISFAMTLELNFPKLPAYGNSK